MTTQNPLVAQHEAPDLACPIAAAVATVKAYSPPAETDDLKALVTVLARQLDDLGHAEDMLMAQALTLDAIYHRLAQRAAQRLDGPVKVTEVYLRLALKAQSQCRATVEALARIKNPAVVIAQQTNIAQNQQVINGTRED